MTQHDALVVRGRGRPAGSSRQAQLARQLVAEGKKPLEALALAGYRNPKREFQRQCIELVRAAHPADEKAVLVEILRSPLAPPHAVISAAEVVFKLLPDEALRQRVVYEIIDVTGISWCPVREFGARVYKIPSEMGHALAAWHRLQAGPASPRDDDSPAAVARRALQSIISRRNGRANDVVKAAKLLLANHLKKVDEATVRFWIPPNGRVPFYAEDIKRTLFIDGSECAVHATWALLDADCEMRNEPQLHAATDWSHLKRPKMLPHTECAGLLQPQTDDEGNGYV